MGNDNLNCVMKFKKENGCSLKHIYNIKSPNIREYTCMFNLNNKYIAFGTKEGFVEIFRLRDQKMVA